MSWVQYEFGDCRVRSDERVVFIRGEIAPLPPKAVDVLLILLEHAGEVVRKQIFMERIWPDADVEEANLSYHVHVLRRVFAELRTEARIRTFARNGYRFESPVRAVIGRNVPARTTRAATGAFRTGVALAASIAITLTTVVRPTPAQALLPARAARIYALGRHALNAGTVGAELQAVRLFRSVVRQAPRNALGYSGMADAYMMLSLERGATRANDGRAVLEYARRAVEIDHRSPQALTSLAAAETFFQRDTARAESTFRTAISLDADYAAAHLWYGTLLAQQGRFASARAEFEHAVDLDPESRDATAQLATADYLLRDYADAALFCKELLAISPGDADAAYLLSLVYAQTARPHMAEAILEREARNPVRRALALGELTVLYASTGKRRLALRAVASLRHSITAGPANPFAVGLAFAATGDRTAAWRWLEKVSARNRHWLAADPRMNGLRRDSQFNAWLSRERSS